MHCRNNINSETNKSIYIDNNSGVLWMTKEVLPQTLLNSSQPLYVGSYRSLICGNQLMMAPLARSVFRFVSVTRQVLLVLDVCSTCDILDNQKY